MCPNRTYFVSKKLTYAGEKRHPGAPQRKDELLHVNGITYYQADLKLNHLRILLAVISALQKPLRFRITRGPQRPKLPEVCLPPKDPSTGYRVLTIPLAEFHFGPKNTTRIRDCLDELCAMPGQATLITGYRFPIYAHSVYIFLSDAALSVFLRIEDGYTGYSHSIALSFTNKYTLRIYWLVCSWKNRGGFVIGVEELRRVLCLSKSYDRVDNIVTHILKPAEEALRSRCPIWFRFRLAVRDGRQIICFKIGYEVSEKQRQTSTSEAWNVCRNLIIAAGGHPESIMDLWSRLDFEDIRSFLTKLSTLTADIRIRRDISNPDAYIHTSMSLWLSDWLIRYGD